MVSLPVVVRHELVNGAEQPPFPQQDQTIETLLADGAHEPFSLGVGIRRLAPSRADHLLHALRNRSQEPTGSRAGSTPTPDAWFMAQAARRLTDAIDGFLARHRVLICDRDAKWT
jgi:hypothetical protein